MIQLYKPSKIELIEDDTHYYRVDNEWFPSVSTILQKGAPTPYALLEWFKNMPPEYIQNRKDTAADRGSAVHAAIERALHREVIKKEEFPDEDDQKVLAGFQNFMSIFQPSYKLEEVEMMVASGKYKYAGTLDFKCEIDPALIEKYTRDTKQKIVKTDNTHWLIDFKTSSTIGFNYYLQLKAYKQAYYEMNGIECNTAILHLKPSFKGGWKLITDMRYNGREVSIDDFMHAYHLGLAIEGGEWPQPRDKAVYPDDLIDLTLPFNEKD